MERFTRFLISPALFASDGKELSRAIAERCTGLAELPVLGWKLCDNVGAFLNKIGPNTSFVKHLRRLRAKFSSDPSEQANLIELIGAAVQVHDLFLDFNSNFIDVDLEERLARYLRSLDQLTKLRVDDMTGSTTLFPTRLLGEEEEGLGLTGLAELCAFYCELSLSQMTNIGRLRQLEYLTLSGVTIYSGEVEVDERMLGEKVNAMLGSLPQLRSFDWASQFVPEDRWIVDISHPTLESLHIYDQQARLERIHCPQLRKLTLYALRIPAKGQPLARIAEASPYLRRIKLSCRLNEEDAWTMILRSRHLKKLRLNQQMPRERGYVPQPSSVLGQASLSSHGVIKMHLDNVFVSSGALQAIVKTCGCLRKLALHRVHGLKDISWLSTRSLVLLELKRNHDLLDIHLQGTFLPKHVMLHGISPD